MKIEELNKAKVLVIGDIILDRYLQGSVSRVSPEAPVPVLKPNDEFIKLGGAANVAFNIKSLGSSARLIGVVGKDESSKEIKRLLGEEKIKFALVQSQFPTISKLRIIASQQQVIRIDSEEKFSYQDWLQTKKLFKRYLKDADVLILSDYGKGTLLDVSFLIKEARKKNMVILVDPKGSDFSIYKGATIITPNYSEFSLAVGDISNEKDFNSKANDLLMKLNLQGLLVTRGGQGMTLFQKDKGKVNRKNFSTKAKEVFDVSGAGDTVIASLGAALASGFTLDSSVELANIAAGIVVGKAGTATASQVEIKPFLKGNRKVVSKPELSTLIRQAKKDSKKIVFTNGCFDILHAGHVIYLQEAKKLGDKLIVGINSDSSVKKLKGKGRPINSLSARIATLAALESVDWVVPFPSETPLSLIKAIQPDILVKGKDYKPSQIVGAEEVKSYGGKVKTIKMVAGFSTSKLIKQIKKISVN